MKLSSFDWRIPVTAIHPKHQRERLLPDDWESVRTWNNRREENDQEAKGI
jgi:hypothetical protein